jgi:peptidoglycan hydrolase CwlO-like protein
MNDNREILEDRLERYEAQLQGLKSYLKELKDKTAEHGTDKAQFEEDLIEAEHNVKYYEAERARLKKELGKSDEGAYPRNVADSILPRTVKQGVGSFVLSAISFVSGALLGSKLKARRGSKDEPEGKERVD